jgi:integrase
MRGTIKQRSKGTWTIWWDEPRGPDGKRRQRNKTIKGRRKDAEAKLREILATLDTGSYVVPSKQSVGDFLNRWLQDYAAYNVRPRTYEGYKAIIDHHLSPAIGHIALTSLTPAHIQSYYSKALVDGRRDGKGGLSARTVKHHHRLVVEALGHAVKWGLVVRNVALAVDPPKPVNLEMHTLDNAGAHKLLDAARETPYYALIHLALYTGMRRSELLGLRWKDVDLGMGALSVVQVMDKLRDGSIVFSEPKTAKSRRMVVLTPTSALALKQHREKQEELAELLGTVITGGDLVFHNLEGSPLSPSTVSHAFLDIARKVGIKNIRLHDLRHSHASLMLKQNVHPKIVQERLGHSTIAITLDLYSHVTPGLQEAAALRSDEGLITVDEAEETA